MATKPHEPVPMVEKLLYDKKSAAFALSVSVRTIGYLLAQKRIRFSRNGNKILIPASEVRRIAKLSQILEA